MRIFNPWLCALGFVAASLLLVSCGTTEVNFERYSLIEDNVFDGACSHAKVTVKPFGVLNDGSVVVKVSEVTLRPAKNHRWSSDLGTQLALIFKKALCDNIKAFDDYEYNLDLYKFYGDLNGNVTVEVRLNVTRSDGTLVNSRIFSREVDQQHDGYPALVMSLKEGWLLVCQDMAASWQELLLSRKKS